MTFRTLLFDYPEITLKEALDYDLPRYEYDGLETVLNSKTLPSKIKLSELSEDDMNILAKTFLEFKNKKIIKLNKNTTFRWVEIEN